MVKLTILYQIIEFTCPEHELIMRKHRDKIIEMVNDGKTNGRRKMRKASETTYTNTIEFTNRESANEFLSFVTANPRPAPHLNAAIEDIIL